MFLPAWPQTFCPFNCLNMLPPRLQAAQLSLCQPRSPPPIFVLRSGSCRGYLQVLGVRAATTRRGPMARSPVAAAARLLAQWPAVLGPTGRPHGRPSH